MEIYKNKLFITDNEAEAEYLTECGYISTQAPSPYNVPERKERYFHIFKANKKLYSDLLNWYNEETDPEKVLRIKRYTEGTR